MLQRIQIINRLCTITVAVALVLLCVPVQVSAKESADLSHSGNAVYTVRYDENEREDDFDLSAHLRTKKDIMLYGQRLSLVFNGRLRTDLDSGKSDRDQAFEEKTDERIYQAYLETKNKGGGRIRLGRQWVHEIENTYIDGLHFSGKNDKVDFTVFGGRAVSEFSSTSSHYVYGGRTRLFRGDYEIRLHFILNDEDPYVNDQVGVGFSRSLWDRQAHAYGDVTFLNNRGRRLRLNLSAFISAFNLDVSARYYERLNRSRPDETSDDRIFSEFFRILNTAQKQRQLGLTLTKYFDDFALGGGLNVTSVDDSNPGNRKAIHGYVNLHFFDFFVKDLVLLLQANAIRNKFSEQYAQDFGGPSSITDAEGRDKTLSLSGQFDYRISRHTRIAAGVSYSDYDFFSSINTGQIFTEEAMSVHGALTNVPHLLYQDLGGSFIVRSYFVRLRTPLGPKWEVRLRLGYDQGGLSKNAASRGYKRFLFRLTRRF